MQPLFAAQAEEALGGQSGLSLPWQSIHVQELACRSTTTTDWQEVRFRLQAYVQRSNAGVSHSRSEAKEWQPWLDRLRSPDGVECPIGVLALSLAVFDFNVFAADAATIGKVIFSSVRSMLKWPLARLVMSGWPIFALLGNIAFKAQLLGRVHALVPFVCGHAGTSDVDADAAMIMRRIFLFNANDHDSEIAVEEAIERLLTRSNHSKAVECLHMASFSDVARAALTMFVARSRDVQNNVVRCGQLLDASQANWYEALRAALTSDFSHQLVAMLAGSLPITRLLTRVQDFFSEPPFGLPAAVCSTHAFNGTVSSQSLSTDSKGSDSVCAACSVPQQAERLFEKMWIDNFAGRVVLRLPADPRIGAPGVRHWSRLAAEAAESADADRSAPQDNSEAWATLICEDNAFPGQKARVRSSFVEAVRVLAHSVRSSESCGLALGVICRPFLVLSVENMLSEADQAALQGDGLKLVTFPTFQQDGVTLPVHNQDGMKIGLGGQQSELGWWMKLRLWSLTQYRRIVFLDADTLVLRPIQALFSLPDWVPLAAPGHPKSDSEYGETVEMSLGVMSIRPNEQIFNVLVSYMAQAASNIDIKMRSLDQVLMHSFVVENFNWQGYPFWENMDGRFSRCAESNEVPQPSNARLEGLTSSGGTLGTFCLLPVQFEFVVSSSRLKEGLRNRARLLNNVFQFADKQDVGKYYLRARVLHWPGPHRKPWLHWSPLARTIFDNMWWEMHDEFCTSVSDSRERLRPCILYCPAL